MFMGSLAFATGAPWDLIQWCCRTAEGERVDAFDAHRAADRRVHRGPRGYPRSADSRSAEAESAGGAQWPTQWSSLNPSFEPGGRVEEPVPAGLLGLEG
jgi:hypothetical protein